MRFLFNCLDQMKPRRGRSRSHSRSHSRSRITPSTKRRDKQVERAQRSRSRDTRKQDTSRPVVTPRVSSPLFPEQSRVPGLIHITGPSGSGKSTLLRMIVNRNVLAIDTDSITDPLERKWMLKPSLSPSEKDAGMQREL
jgi:ABC-type glutathione transport system ATPase component